MRLLLPLVVAILALIPAAAAPPVSLSVENAAASRWDTDPAKVGLELQITNRGTAPAHEVRVTAVDVRGGALARAYSALPIALGTIHPQGSALLDLVVAVPRLRDGAYKLTIAGTYRVGGMPQRFSLSRAVMPSAAPGPLQRRTGAAATQPAQLGGPVQPPASGRLHGFAPNAATPMLIPPGPPRRTVPPVPNAANPAPLPRR